MVGPGDADGPPEGGPLELWLPRSLASGVVEMDGAGRRARERRPADHAAAGLPYGRRGGTRNRRVSRARPGEAERRDDAGSGDRGEPHARGAGGSRHRAGGRTRRR